ncbi:hypothetical protein DL770_006051 [Monosporascus sp. CRB-9-2]|nr:hypothetical protein DL770_006051 [Monosporascus sp. CRB-9-2]
MSDWDTVTKIGSKARGGASQRETVLRGNSALNAAKRTGAAIITDKKHAVGNAAKGSGSGIGQFHTKVDRSVDIIKPKTVGREVGKAIEEGRRAFQPTMTQVQLAKQCNMTPQQVAQYEAGNAAPNQEQLGRMEQALKVKLRGEGIGTKLEHKGKKSAAKPAAKPTAKPAAKPAAQPAAKK